MTLENNTPPAQSPDVPAFAAAHSSAASCEKCEGCQHRDHADRGAWCYMFAEAPEELPCSQHDKFADLRRKMGKYTSAFAFITGAFPHQPNKKA